LLALWLFLGALALTSCGQLAQEPAREDAGGEYESLELLGSLQTVAEVFNLNDPADVRRLIKLEPDRAPQLEELLSRLEAQGVGPAQTPPPICFSEVRLYRSWPLGNPFARHRVSCDRRWNTGRISAEIFNFDTFERRFRERILTPFTSAGSVDSGTIPWRQGHNVCGYGRGTLVFPGWTVRPNTEACTILL